jgi:serine phosphatase RsbU (regulator of sigma subunit)
VSTLAFGEGSRLVLYTDGPVEHRGSDIALGIDTLIDVLGPPAQPIHALPGAAVERLLPGGEPDDDIAILSAVLRHSDVEPLTVAVTFKGQRRLGGAPSR